MVRYQEPFKWLSKVTLPNSEQRVSGFDGPVSWTTGAPGGAQIDKSVLLESVRRDADLQYALHQPEIHKIRAGRHHGNSKAIAAIGFVGPRIGGKDNNQLYDVNTGLLVGYRFSVGRQKLRPDHPRV